MCYFNKYIQNALNFLYSSLSPPPPQVSYDDNGKVYNSDFKKLKLILFAKTEDKSLKWTAKILDNISRKYKIPTKDKKGILAGESVTVDFAVFIVCVRTIVEICEVQVEVSLW